MLDHWVGSKILVIMMLLFRDVVESKLRSTSFNCPCGKDPNNDDQNVYKVGRYGQRIIGGEDVKNPNPWFVYIKFQSKNSASQFRCGGTLLNQKWAVTAAHCFCNTKKKFKCKKKKGRYQFASLYIGINKNHVERFDRERFRGIGKVIIHEDYEIGGVDTFNDVALVKFDRPLHKSKWALKSNTALINPICLPDNSYKEEGKLSFVIGFGLEFQKACRTNKKGPDIYAQCASGTILKKEMINTTINHWYEDKNKNKILTPGCSGGRTPATRLDDPCLAFNHDKQDEMKKANEIVLVPKDRSKKPYSCFHQDDLIHHKNERKQKQNKIERSSGWCGTCVQGAKNNTPGYCGPGSGSSNQANYARVTADSGWGFCTEECRGATAQWSEHKLQIVEQSILSAQECQMLLKGIESNKTLNAEKQLCAGNKIKQQKQLFYEYEGPVKNMVFTPIKPVRKYRSPQKQVVSSLNFMIGGKDSCYGDSGGPLWTRENIKGEDLAYLVGVVSAGSVTDCANLNSPAFYTRIKYFVKWIKKHASDGRCRSKNRKKRNKKNKKSLRKKRKRKPIKKKKMSRKSKNKKEKRIS